MIIEYASGHERHRKDVMRRHRWLPSCAEAFQRPCGHRLEQHAQLAGYRGACTSSMPEYSFSRSARIFLEDEQINQCLTKIEKKILDEDKKYDSKIEECKGEHVDRNQGKAVITGFHSETPEPEVIQLLKASITEIGMTIENARIECLRSRSHMLSFTSRTMKKETNASGQRTC